MNVKYRILKSELESLKHKLDVIVNDDSPGTFLEDRIIFNDCENLYEKLQDTIRNIEYYSKPVKEGTLRRMENDKYELLDGKGKQITYFACGDAIECFVEVDDENLWIAGRVEHKSTEDDEGYYFYNRAAGHPFLYDGMQARIRTSY